jgi:hypothetical protein
MGAEKPDPRSRTGAEGHASRLEAPSRCTARVPTDAAALNSMVCRLLATWDAESAHDDQTGNHSNPT